MLGQTDGKASVETITYTASSEENAPNALGFRNSVGVAVDTTGHCLFVVDNGNSRVLVFNLTTDNTISDYEADYVLGQTDFTSSSYTSATQSTLRNVAGMAYDTTRDLLFVSDILNHRVLIFDVALINNGENAVNVLGQSTFSANSSATTAIGFNYPEGLAYDQTNSRLFVSEVSNNRVTVL